MDKSEVPNVYDNTTNVVEVKLTRFLYDVTEGIEDYRYMTIEEWVIAQRQFWTYMREAEWWQQLQFMSTILGVLC